MGKKKTSGPSAEARRLGISRGRMYQLNYPEKDKARRVLTAAVKSGKLTRPFYCEGCGKEEKLAAHHDDYTRPLDVRWFCTFCHTGVHTKPQPVRLFCRLEYPPEVVARVKAHIAKAALRKRLETVVEVRPCIDCGKERNMTRNHMYVIKYKQHGAVGLRCQRCNMRKVTTERIDKLNMSK